MSRAARYAKHAGIAVAVAHDFDIPGVDPDDLCQEARVALWVATGSYDPGRGVPFPAFAGMVVRRRLTSLLKAALTHRHSILTRSVRVAVLRDGDGLEEVAIVDTLAGGRDPAEIVVARETFERVRAGLERLTEREREGLALNLAGVPGKRVGNAAWAARRKLREAVA